MATAFQLHGGQMGETWATCTCLVCGGEFKRWLPTPLYSTLEELDRRLAAEAKRWVCPSC